MTSISRRLSLHASALSDDEYQFYTTSLLSIASIEDDGGSRNMDDAYYETMNINLRETRAWLRGRYSDISSLTIDKILKLFSPKLSATDSLSGGEFFAILRLIIHAENGKEVDRSLAFVQAQAVRSLNSVPHRRSYTDLSLATSSAESSFPHNPFTHHQPPLHPSQRSEPTPSHSAHNPFIHRTLPTLSDDGNAKLPPLPPRKHPIPQPAVPPPKHITSSHNPLDRSRSPSKLVSTTNSLQPSSPHPPTIPPKPIHHITSTLIKQSLQATKAAQTMKKAEEQLERERVMQVLKSSSTVSGAYSLAGASVTNSSIAVGTNIYNQHQYQQQQQRRSPSPMMGHGHGGTGSGLNKKIGYAATSTSSGSDERAPPLPKRRTQQQPSPPLSISSLEQVALATTHPHPTSAPPSSTASAFSNPESSSNAHVHAYPSHFRSKSRVPVDSTIAIPYSSSPEQSPRRSSLDLPSGGTARGRPPPTHPDRKPQHLLYQYHARSQSYAYSDPFASSNLDSKDPLSKEVVDESFERIYGPSSVNTPSSPPTTSSITPTTPSPNRAFRSKSFHHPSPPIPPVSHLPLGRKRPESVKVFRTSDIGVEVDENELTENRNSHTNSSGNVSRHMPTLAANSNNNNNSDGRSSLSISATHLSSSSSLGHWPPSPHRQTQSGLSSSSSSSTLTSPAGLPHLHPRPPSSTSSITTVTMKHDPIPTPTLTPNPLTSLQKTFLQIQPHLDKARYKAEAGLSKRGFVRDGLRTRGKNSGSVGADGDGEEEEDGLEDGLEGLMGGGNDGGGKKHVGMSRWRVHHDGSDLDRAYDGEVDQDSDWTRSEGMSMSSDLHRGQRRANRQYSDGDEDGNGVGLEKDNLKWPVGEGWKPL